MPGTWGSTVQAGQYGGYGGGLPLSPAAIFGQQGIGPLAGLYGFGGGYGGFAGGGFGGGGMPGQTPMPAGLGTGMGYQAQLGALGEYAPARGQVYQQAAATGTYGGGMVPFREQALWGRAQPEAQGRGIGAMSDYAKLWARAQQLGQARSVYGAQGGLMGQRLAGQQGQTWQNQLGQMLGAFGGLAAGG